MHSEVANKKLRLKIYDQHGDPMHPVWTHAHTLGPIPLHKLPRDVPLIAEVLITTMKDTKDQVRTYALYAAHITKWDRAQLVDIPRKPPGQGVLRAKRIIEVERSATVYAQAKNMKAKALPVAIKQADAAACTTILVTYGEDVRRTRSSSRNQLKI